LTDNCFAILAEIKQILISKSCSTKHFKRFYFQVGEGIDLIIHHPDTVLENMSEWCIEHHGKSGLTEAVKKSKV